jgi:calcineurin-like phosphoesterase family protein
MNGPTFYTADTHFFHDNIRGYCNRPFKDVTEMNETLITNWNAKVPQDGIVYHLGDFSFGSADDALKIRQRLNGKICLIRGNHEKPALTAHQSHPRMFEWVRDVYELRIDKSTTIFMSHFAHRVWNKSGHGSWMLCGHSHGTLKEILPAATDGKILDVGVDVHNYSPISLNEVRAIMDKKEISKADHH